jgi:hypothetical protein
MAHETIPHLLDRVAAIHNRCDLDVLVYLFRHADALLTGEYVASAVGCDLNEVAGSLDSLVLAGLLTRKRSRTEGAGMYVFAVGRPAAGPLASLLQLASSRRAPENSTRASRVSGHGASAHLDGDDASMRDKRKGRAT